MGQTDPLTILTQGMRRMSSLRFDDITRGFENFANPSARGMLESMGRTRDEQVNTMVEMLRNSSQADIDEMGQVFGLAMAKLAEEHSNGERAEGPARRRRDQTAAEWRRERRLTS
jgi:hypothetical protein